MTIEIVLKEIKKNHESMKGASTTAERYNFLYEITSLLNEYPEAKEYWVYRPLEHYLVDRVYQKKEYTRPRPLTIHPSMINFHEANITIENHIVIDKEICSHDDPSMCGLYFVGQTNFNPYTGETFYWLKIGMSCDIHKRMTSYNTCCPQLFRIDYFECSNSADARACETLFHEMLSSKALGRCQHNAEWYLVDRETYLNACDMGFEYFRAM